jgi:hypothetical protein
MKQANNKYRIEQNKLIIDNSEIVFDFPIKDFIEIGDMLIVYLDLYDDVIPLEENVFGISLVERKIKWQIEKRKYPTGGYAQMRCPFVGISFHENKLRLHNWCSTNLIVDPVTGGILGEEETR